VGRLAVSESETYVANDLIGINYQPVQLAHEYI
jgi:hypothetical protein